MMVTYFDWALVGIVGLVFSYIVIMATINTAHEGVAFGRQHNSTYTLIRAILGPVLMFPIPTVIPSSGTIVSSFSALQAIVMHLVLIGVNMANIVWYHTVGAAMYMPPSQLPGPIQSMVAQQVAAEGVGRVAILSDEPEKYGSDSQFPGGTSIDCQLRGPGSTTRSPWVCGLPSGPV